MADEYAQENEDIQGDLASKNNAQQLNARMLIGRKSEMMRQKNLAEEGGEEMSGVDDGIPDDDPAGGMTDAYPYQVGDETLKKSLQSLPKAAEAAPKTYKLKVNGKEIELSEDEMIARVQKIEAADQYLAEAKCQAEAMKLSASTPAPSDESDAPKADTLADEDLRLARDLQVGSEEDAAKAIKALRSTVKAPSVNLDELAKRTIDTIQFQEDARWFQEEYKDVFADPKLAALALQMDEQKRRAEMEAGKPRRYRDRYQEIGEELRTWIGSNPGFDQKKQQKKESLTSIPQASVKTQRPVEDDDSEESPASVIAQMAKARGQLRI
jgi:hypothetical protein